MDPEIMAAIITASVALVAALLTAFASLVVASVSAISTRRQLASDRAEWETRLSDAREKWERELDAKLTEMALSVLQGNISQRLIVYPEVFETIGRFPDVPYTSGMRPKPDKAALLQIASDIEKQLCGKPGLVMEMETRNCLWEVWLACHRYPDGIGWDELVDTFFFARRHLRADLQLEDIPGVENRLKMMLDKVTKRETAEEEAARSEP